MFALGQLYTGIKIIWPHIYVTDLLGRYCCPLVTCLSSILFKNRWWCLFHRGRRLKTVRSNQRKHLKSGLTCIKPQQSCLISTVVASQRLPTRSCHCQATRCRLFLFSSSLLLLLLPLPCLQKTLEKRWSHLVDSAHCSSFCQDFDNLTLSRAGEFGDSGEDFEVKTHLIVS